MTAGQNNTNKHTPTAARKACLSILSQLLHKLYKENSLIVNLTAPISNDNKQQRDQGNAHL